MVYDTVLHTILNYTPLFYAVLHLMSYTVLYCEIPFSAMLHYTMLSCNMVLY